MTTTRRDLLKIGAQGALGLGLAPSLLRAQSAAPTPAPTPLPPVHVEKMAGVAPAARMQSGSLTVTLAPWQVAFYSPDDASIPGYSFFR